MPNERVRQQLHQVFGESLTTTGRVLITPSDVLRKQAQGCIERCSVEHILEDLAQVTADEVGDELHAAGLRPADFADMEELPAIVSRRLIAALQTPPADFVKNLRETLRLKG